MAGISRLFIGICLRAVEIFKIMMRSSHLDSSSLSEEKDVHANHVEAFNSAIRRYLAAFVVVQILMLNLLWDYSES